MAKSKYDENTFPLLAEGYAREGLTDKQIAANLNISESTLNTYKLKYPEFLEALKKGKGPVDFEVENALLKRALGFEYDEEHTEIKTESYKVGKQKTAVTKTFKTKRIVTKLILPDVAACIFWLKNRRSKQWREKIEDFGTGENMNDKLQEFNKLIREGDTK